MATIAEQRRPDVQQVKPPICAALPCSIHGGVPGQRMLKYHEPYTNPFTQQTIQQPYQIYEGVRPFGLIVKLMELFRELERSYLGVVSERDDLYTKNVHLLNEAMRKDKAISEYERQLFAKNAKAKAQRTEV